MRCKVGCGSSDGCCPCNISQNCSYGSDKFLDTGRWGSIDLHLFQRSALIPLVMYDACSCQIRQQVAVRIIGSSRGATALLCQFGGAAEKAGLHISA